MRVEQMAPAVPRIKPAPTSFMPWEITNRITFPQVAPRAMRIPISWVFWVTKKANTPYRPSTTSARATMANKPRIVVMERVPATEFERASFMVWALPRTIFRSRSQIRSWIGRIRLLGSVAVATARRMVFAGCWS